MILTVSADLSAMEVVLSDSSTLPEEISLITVVSSFCAWAFCCTRSLTAVICPIIACTFFDNSACCSRSEEHTSELQSRFDLVCRLLLEKKKSIILLYLPIRHT